MKIQYKDGKWIELPKHSRDGIYIDRQLKEEMDLFYDQVINDDWDATFLIDGAEGSGKSSLTQLLGKYLDPTLDLSRITFTAEQFIQAARSAKKGQCVIFDEAFGGLSSSGSMSKMNREIVRMLTEIRDKNLFIFIVLPSFFDLQKYAALHRGLALIHVTTHVDDVSEKLKRGDFKYYNIDAKRILYIKGKEFYNYNCVKETFQGRFPKFWAVDIAEYKKKKHESCSDKKEAHSDILDIRNKAFTIMKKGGHSNEWIANEFGISERHVRRIIKQEEIKNEKNKCKEEESSKEETGKRI